MHGLTVPEVHGHDSASARTKNSAVAQNTSDNASKRCKQLYVCTTQNKLERESELRGKFANSLVSVVSKPNARTDGKSTSRISPLT